MCRLSSQNAWCEEICVHKLWRKDLSLFRIQCHFFWKTPTAEKFKYACVDTSEIAGTKKNMTILLQGFTPVTEIEPSKYMAIFGKLVLPKTILSLIESQTYQVVQSWHKHDNHISDMRFNVAHKFCEFWLWQYNLQKLWSEINGKFK